MPFVTSPPTQHKNAPPAPEWHHIPQPSAQQSNIEVSFIPESGVEAATASLALEDEGKPIGIIYCYRRLLRFDYNIGT